MSRQIGEVPSRTFKAGDVIFKEGDDAKSEAFLIHEGKVEVRKQIIGQDRLLRVLGKAELLGELALFRNAPRSATAIAAEPVTLLLFNANKLNAMVRSNHALAMALIKDLSDRMLAAEDRARDAEKRAQEAEERTREPEKSDFTEELARLRAHVSEIARLLDEVGAGGKRT